MFRAGHDLEVSSHVPGGLTHNGLPRNLGVVLQALHRGPVEGHGCRLVAVREHGFEPRQVCLQLAGHMDEEAEQEGGSQTASELHHATCHSEAVCVENEQGAKAVR